MLALILLKVKRVSLKLKSHIKFQLAFTLIELTIYLSIFFIIITILFSFFNSMHKDVVNKARQNDLFIRNSLALDLLRRDISSANPMLQNWYKANEKGFDYFVFKKETLTVDFCKISKFISWQLKKRRLNRIEGIYDFKTKQWGKKVISLICSHVNEFKFNLILAKNKKLVKGINLCYSIDDKNFEERIMLQNRVV